MYFCASSKISQIGDPADVLIGLGYLGQLSFWLQAELAKHLAAAVVKYGTGKR